MFTGQTTGKMGNKKILVTVLSFSSNCPLSMYVVVLLCPR